MHLLDKYGVHMTAEEIREAKEEAKAELEKMGYYRDGELSEELLMTVAGGKNGRTRRVAGVLIGALGVATANPFFFAAGCELFCWGCLG